MSNAVFVSEIDNDVSNVVLKSISKKQICCNIKIRLFYNMMTTTTQIIPTNLHTFNISVKTYLRLGQTKTVIFDVSFN